MKKLIILPVAALAFAAFSPVAQATGVTSGGETSGTACGATALLEDGAAGVLNPGEVDWYDASYTSAGPRDVSVTAPPSGIFFLSQAGWEARIFLYEWDKATNTCTQVDFGGCTYGLFGDCGVGVIGSPTTNTVVQPAPGDYQIAVDRQAITTTPNAYVLQVE